MSPLALVALLATVQGPAPWPAIVAAAELKGPPFADTFSDAVRLDARSAKEFEAGHLVGSQRIDWLDYRESWLHGGGLREGRVTSDVAGLTRKLEALGVDTDRPVLVCGDGATGWGEEGRIAWMLRYLGQTRVSLLDGGCAAAQAAGLPWTRDVTAPIPGRLHVVLQPSLRASVDEVRHHLAAHDAQIVDARTLEEFRGATPYWEARGGHIPGAHHLDMRRLFKVDGSFLRGRDLDRVVERAGLRADLPVIVYCTGGVRSALVVEVLRNAGFDAKNYDGSMWEWAGNPELPLVQELTP